MLVRFGRFDHAVMQPAVSAYDRQAGVLTLLYPYSEN